jgi:hypothetical protein
MEGVPSFCRKPASCFIEAKELDQTTRTINARISWKGWKKWPKRPEAVLAPISASPDTACRLDLGPERKFVRVDVSGHEISSFDCRRTRYVDARFCARLFKHWYSHGTRTAAGAQQKMRSKGVAISLRRLPSAESCGASQAAIRAETRLLVQEAQGAFHFR